MRNLIDYFQAGTIHRERKCYVFKVSKFSDLKTKILPFFKEFSILGSKGKDFRDWEKTLELLDQKVQLTNEGIEKIKKIKEGMNYGRK